MYIRLLAACAVLLTASLAVPGHAAAEAAFKNREGKFQMGAGIGIGADPLGFAGGIEAQFFPADTVSIGPRFSFIPAETRSVDENIYLLMLDLRFHPSMGSKLQRLRPFIGIGGGLSIIDFSVFGVGPTDVSVALEFGAGVNFFISDDVSIGTQAQLVFPLGGGSGRFDEDALFEWQIVHFDFVF